MLFFCTKMEDIQLLHLFFLSLYIIKYTETNYKGE